MTPFLWLEKRSGEKFGSYFLAARSEAVGSAPLRSAVLETLVADRLSEYLLFTAMLHLRLCFIMLEQR